MAGGEFFWYDKRHCPKTHEQFPSSFVGNAEVISSDGRNMFIDFFPEVLYDFFYFTFFYDILKM
jgi:hypothetical protein